MRRTAAAATVVSVTRRGRAFAVAAALALVLTPWALVSPPLAAQEFDVSVDGVDDLSGLTAVVAHSDDGVNFRAEPGQAGEIIDTLPDGTVVALRIDEADTVYGDDGTRWWPVRYDGQDGWIAGFYLDDAGGASPSDDSDDDGSSLDTPSFGAGDYVAASTDDGAGLNMRSGPGTDFERVATIRNGDVVQVMGGPEYDGDGNGWYLITDGDVTGYSIAGYLTAATQPEAPADEPEPEDVLFGVGDYVTSADGDGVNIRFRGFVGSDVVGAISGDGVVRIVGDPIFDGEGSAWYKVDDGDVRGYALGRLLVATDAPAVEPDREEVVFGVGDYITPADGDGVNIRFRGFVGSDVVGAISGDGVVQIVGEAVFDDEGRAWYKVDDGDSRGYALGRLLVATSAPAPPSGPTGSFIYPVANYVFTQAYGCTGFSFEPYDANLGCNFHNGIDLAAPSYTPIMAADGGVVVAAGWCDCGLGYYVEIDHGNGFATVYGHMAEQPYVFVGQKVNQGDVIGPMGSTGFSTGPHVHFMVKRNGSTVDPTGYVG